MAKFKKKPVVINAIQNDGEWKTIIDWLDELAGGRAIIPIFTHPIITRNHDGSLSIETLEGVMRCEITDWVICGVKGEFYPCKADIFEATYEPV